MSPRIALGYAFYLMCAFFMIHRASVILNNDMFSLDVLMNSLLSMTNPSVGEYDIMKVSRPVLKPLHPPPTDYSIITDREEL